MRINITKINILIRMDGGPVEMKPELELYDVTIIGGGPAGMYSAFYSGMRDMNTKLIEARDRLGGRMLFYPEKMIWDVGGVTPILCEDLIKQLEQQARTFDPTLVFGQQIEGSEASSKAIYEAYLRWCEDNAQKPMSANRISSELAQNERLYNVEATNNVYAAGKRVRGFIGVEAMNLLPY